MTKRAQQLKVVVFYLTSFGQEKPGKSLFWLFFFPLGGVKKTKQNLCGGRRMIRQQIETVLRDPSLSEERPFRKGGMLPQAEGESKFRALRKDWDLTSVWLTRILFWLIYDDKTIQFITYIVRNLQHLGLALS